jgi:RNA polymerase sigma-70 factor, ECF subfamily
MARRFGHCVTSSRASRLVDSRVNPADASSSDDLEVVKLVDRAVARDSAAFAELYERYLERVYRYVFYRTGNRTDAEDLAEQTFLKAWAAIEGFRWRGKPFLSWLYVMAHNVVIDWRRRAGNPAQSLDDAEQPLELESARAGRDMVQWIDAELLANAIQRLTPDQQQVITLKFIAGYDTAEIADMLNKREGTIRALQLRALQSLRRDLERQGESWAA